MKTTIDIHIIQTVPPANMNRDDTGAPKTAVFGGKRRARVSSQAWKRATRERFNEILDPTQVGTRTKEVVTAVSDQIVTRRQDLADRATALAVEVLEKAGLKITTKKGKGGSPDTRQLGYLMFLSRAQINNLAAAACEAADQGSDYYKEHKVKELADKDHSIDIALFGRMVADAPDLNVDAACQVAHALGTHAVTQEFDYYTALDDLQGENESGAGMIGTVEFYSTTLYRYATINVDLLAENLGSQEATKLAIQAFVDSFVSSMPSGKQNTFANGTLPEAVMVTVDRGQSINLAGAFEEPLTTQGGYSAASVQALAKYAGEVQAAWHAPKRAFVAGFASAVGPLKDLGEPISLERLGDTVAEAAIAQTAS